MRRILLLLCALVIVALSAATAQAQNTVTVSFVYDLVDSAAHITTGCSPIWGRLIDQDGKTYDVSYVKNKITVIQVPAGIYDFTISFNFSYPTMRAVGSHHATLVKEGLNLHADTTIIASVKDAKNVVRFEFLLPDGKTKLTGDSIGLIAMSVPLRHKDRYQINNVNAVGNGVISQYGNAFSVRNSNMSSDYVQAVVNWIRMKADSITCTAHIIGEAVAGIDSSVTVVNDASRYVTIDDYYRLCPAGVKAANTGIGSGGNLIDVNGDEWFLLGGGAGNRYFTRPDTGKVAHNVIKICDSMTGVSATYLKVAGYTSRNDAGYYTKSPYYCVVDGRAYAIVRGSSPFVYGKLNGSKRNFMTPHPQFSYFKDQMGENLLGNSVPVVNISTKTNKYFNNRLESIVPTFVGRFGEERGQDQHYAYLTLALGDSIISQGKLSPSIGVTEWAQRTTGTLNLTIADSSVVVDDAPAQNITTVSLDLSQNERSIPSLQMLQYRNSATEKVTDRFETNSASDEILIAGANFTYDADNDIQVPSTANIQVSYSPSGKDEWKPLEVTEEPDNYRAVAFGNFYRGNLKDVDVKSATKWYDLRVVLTAGNATTQQIIKPAFRIDKIESNSVVSVTAARAVQSVRYYDLTGHQSAQPFSGVNVVVTTYTDGTIESRKVLR